MDQTGQQQDLSLTSSKHCREALRIWRVLTSPENLSKCSAQETQDRLGRMSETQVLGERETERERERERGGGGKRGKR
jgi:hypothetical protein